MPIAVVSAEFFRFFDAPPVLGRYFTASEDAPPDGAPVAVLTQSAWRSQFGSRQDIVGTAVQIGPLKYTIIGVAPEKFVGLWPDRPPVAFIPLATFAASDGGRNWTTNNGRGFGLEMMVRRKPGISVRGRRRPDKRISSGYQTGQRRTRATRRQLPVRARWRRRS